MNQNIASSSRASGALHPTTSNAPMAAGPRVGYGLPGAHAPSSMEQLRSAVAELYVALASTLNNERDCAENSLRRAAAILQVVDVTHAPRSQRPKGGLAPWQIRLVTTHIESNLTTPIKSCELAAIARLSSCHFSRVFRESLGCSPVEYISQRRVERAQGLMLSTVAPLSQIALDCGLADQAHLSRLFRRFVGESPSAWRRARLNPLPGQ
jgi:transcriptional regulator GlxA family with amidase domain